MRAVVQRVSHSCVTVEGARTGETGCGLLVLVGVAKTDKATEASKLAQKVAFLRIFEDEQGKLNKSVGDIGGGVLVVSNFTLYGDCRRGRRPDFSAAAAFDDAYALYNEFVAELMKAGVENIQSGRFGADMQVELINDGPVTIMLDTDDLI